MFVKMVMIYVRGAKERRYLRDLLGPLVRQVLEDDFLDLESDPLMVITHFFWHSLNFVVFSLCNPCSHPNITFHTCLHRSTKPVSTTRNCEPVALQSAHCISTTPKP